MDEVCIICTDGFDIVVVDDSGASDVFVAVGVEMILILLRLTEVWL